MNNNRIGFLFFLLTQMCFGQERWFRQVLKIFSSGVHRAVLPLQMLSRSKRSFTQVKMFLINVKLRFQNVI
jgi:hypothetical protein